MIIIPYRSKHCNGKNRVISAAGRQVMFYWAKKRLKPPSDKQKKALRILLRRACIKPFQSAVYRDLHHSVVMILLNKAALECLNKHFKLLDLLLELRALIDIRNHHLTFGREDVFDLGR